MAETAARCRLRQYVGVRFGHDVLRYFVENGKLRSVLENGLKLLESPRPGDGGTNPEETVEKDAIATLESEFTKYRTAPFACARAVVLLHGLCSAGRDYALKIRDDLHSSQPITHKTEDKIIQLAFHLKVPSATTHVDGLRSDYESRNASCTMRAAEADLVLQRLYYYGCSRSFDDLWEQNSDDLRASLASHTRDPQLVTETIDELHMAFPQLERRWTYDFHLPWSRWAWRNVRNKCVDIFRSRHEHGHQQLSPSTPGPSVPQDLLIEYHASIARLPEIQRCVFMLSNDGWSRIDGSMKLGISVTSWDKALHAARETLRRDMTLALR